MISSVLPPVRAGNSYVMRGRIQFTRGTNNYIIFYKGLNNIERLLLNFLNDTLNLLYQNPCLINLLVSSWCLFTVLCVLYYVHYVNYVYYVYYVVLQVLELKERELLQELKRMKGVEGKKPTPPAGEHYVISRGIRYHNYEDRCSWRKQRRRNDDSVCRQ